MTLRYLVDTDWVIDHLNQIDRVVRKLRELRPHGLALSIISLAELYEGMHYSRDSEQSQQAFETFHSLDLALRQALCCQPPQGEGG